MKVEDEPLTMPKAGKTEEVWQRENDFRTGFLSDFRPPRPVDHDRQETARFPHEPAPAPRAQSQIMCVGTFDLASVSPSLRSVSNNLRRDTPIVSPNLRRKPPLIARRTVYDCAPLHLADSGERGATKAVDVPCRGDDGAIVADDDVGAEAGARADFGIIHGLPRLLPQSGRN